MRLTKYAGLIATIAIAVAVSMTSLPAFAASGTFKGINNHVASGKVSVEKRGNGYVIVLANSFKFDGAPDPRIAFGNNGKFAADTDFKPLKSNNGAQEYLVPASIDVSKYNEVQIWCRKFSVGLAIAKLK
ncbi:MAG: DM13 domain-containing protein [Stappiaceae bacterium]